MRSWILLVFLVVPPALGEQTAARRVDELAWMAGSWCSRSAGATAEEHWLAPHGGVILGLHRDVREAPDGPRAFFEFLRIGEEEGSIFYYASPAGRPATPFRLAEMSERRVAFENREHDYPQRIIYQRSGDELTSTIEGEVDGEARSSSWRWQKDACGFLAGEGAAE